MCPVVHRRYYLLWVRAGPDRRTPSAPDPLAQVSQEAVVVVRTVPDLILWPSVPVGLFLTAGPGCEKARWTTVLDQSPWKIFGCHGGSVKTLMFIIFPPHDGIGIVLHKGEML